MDDQPHTGNVANDNSLDAAVADFVEPSPNLDSAFLTRQAEQGNGGKSTCR
jgi:hypothetical protein